jgi:hypothetical protein
MSLARLNAADSASLVYELMPIRGHHSGTSEDAASMEASWIGQTAQRPALSLIKRQNH